jgi:hypothetical protein
LVQAFLKRGLYKLKTIDILKRNKMAENENQQYMHNFWNNNSFDFMMLLLKCHLWLDEGCYFSLGTCDE